MNQKLKFVSVVDFQGDRNKLLETLREKVGKDKTIKFESVHDRVERVRRWRKKGRHFGKETPVKIQVRSKYTRYTNNKSFFVPVTGVKLL